ncbi:MAG: hypothetical protein ACD_70C00052G0003, partial [uncultured bacterium]
VTGEDAHHALSVATCITQIVTQNNATYI